MANVELESASSSPSVSLSRASSPNKGLHLYHCYADLFPTHVRIGQKEQEIE